MKIQVYSAHPFEKIYFEKWNTQGHQFRFTPASLSLETIDQAQGCEGVACFVADTLNQEIIQKLSEMGIRLIALRSAGYDYVDRVASKAAGITIAHVPAYSPQAVAEFAVGLILAVNRKIVKASLQGLNYDFSLEGLLGFNLHEKTIGIIGTGHIGTAFAKIMKGFGSHLLASDPVQNPVCSELGVRYVPLEELLRMSDVVSLHCPLTESTAHLLGRCQFLQMKPGALLINTGRGGLIDTAALVEVLESGHLGGAGLDVYEKEKGLFFKNHQGNPPQDPLFSELQKLPGVVITPHQAFLTQEAVSNIVETTVANVTAFEKGKAINLVVV